MFIHKCWNILGGRGSKIRDFVTNEDVIVVTGGERDSGPEGTLDWVELLFQFNQNVWTSGRGASMHQPLFKKSNIGWPQQPLKERVPNINKK